MDEIEERAKAQLMMIERVYALKIANREEIAQLIAEKVNNDRQVLTICSFEVTEWQSRHA